MSNAEARRQRQEDAGKLILRVSLGLMILFHGVSKLFHGVDGISGMLAAHGLPAGVAYLVLIGEVLAPVLLIVGLWARLAAIVVAINMLVAVLLAHTAQFFTLTPQGGWALELQGMYFLSAVAVALLGAGWLSVGGARGRWN